MSGPLNPEPATHAIDHSPADAVDVEQPPSSRISYELNRQLWNDLRVASFTLAALYVIFAIAHPYTVGGSSGRQLAFVAAASAVVLAAYGLWLRRSRNFELANLTGAVFAGLVLFNSALHLLLTRDTVQSTNFVVLVVAIGTFFLSLPWCVAAIAVVGIVWGAALQWLGSDHRGHYAFAFLSASLVAALAFYARTHALRRSIVDAWRECRHREKLEAADAELTRANIELEKRVTERTSELREQIEQTRRMEQAALEAEKLAVTGRMAATIAHEINNPLEILSSLVYLIHKRPDDAAQILSLSADAQVQVHRLAHITKQTLSLYRQSLRPAVVNLRELMSQCIDLYGEAIREKRIQLELRGQGDVAVECYETEIRQVFSNLLLNCLEASGTGASMVIRIRRLGTADSGITVSFCDEGRGIAAELRQSIFKPFFTTKGHPGTGLGLWVALGIVTRHGGRIRLRSSTDKDRHGTVVSVWLPNSLFAIHPGNLSSGRATSPAEF